jgi:hypothetical protein
MHSRTVSLAYAALGALICFVLFGPSAGAMTCTSGVRISTGGRTGCRVRRHKPLPPMKWKSLDAALKSGKPVVAVFTTRAFRGPAVFDNHDLRACLKASGAVAARVLPPEAPNTKGCATREEFNAAMEGYREKLKAYGELARKYGANVNPTMVCIAPGGDVVARLHGPGGGEVERTLKGLPETIRRFRAAKNALEGATGGGMGKK